MRMYALADGTQCHHFLESLGASDRVSFPVNLLERDFAGMDIRFGKMCAT